MFNKTIFYLTLFLILGVIATPAQARHQDMMDNVPWNPVNRPSVPSDRTHKQDMFGSYQTIRPTKSDMLGSQKRSTFNMREDMLSQRPAPEPIGKMFGSWADQ